MDSREQEQNAGRGRGKLGSGQLSREKRWVLNGKWPEQREGVTFRSASRTGLHVGRGRLLSRKTPGFGRELLLGVEEDRGWVRKSKQP